MSQLYFPKLPGLTWDISTTPTWSTVEQVSKNRARTAVMNDPFPQWAIELSYEFLFDKPNQVKPTPQNPRGYTDLQQIVGFFNQMGGSFGDFLLDPGMLTDRTQDSTVNGVQVGTGDGVTTTFYLAREYGGFLDEVQNPINPVISVAGTIQAASTYTIGSTGAVTFNTAPPLNEAITWSGRWAFRCCFAKDQLEVEAMMFELYELQKVSLMEVKL